MINAVSMRAADVFYADGIKLFDSKLNGFPSGVNINAISRDTDECGLVFSIDQAAVIDGTPYRTDDLILWDSDNGFDLLTSLNLNINVDALHVFTSNNMLISTDTGISLSNVEVFDDDIIELFVNSQETLQLLAFSPTNFDTSWQATDIKSLWVVLPGNPGEISFPFHSKGVDEQDGFVSIQIQRYPGTFGDITVNWSTQDINTTTGIDYSTISGDLTLLDGQNSAEFNIVIVDDDVIEPAESFNVILDSVTGGATLSNNNTLRITIADNDDLIFKDNFESKS
jgi:hypothetical protein